MQTNSSQGRRAAAQSALNEGHGSDDEQACPDVSTAENDIIKQFLVGNLNSLDRKHSFHGNFDFCLSDIAL